MNGSRLDPEAMRAIARLTMSHIDELPSNQAKILLLQGLSQILPRPEARYADNVAFMLRKAEENQLQFIALLRGEKASRPDDRGGKLNDR